MSTTTMDREPELGPITEAEIAQFARELAQYEDGREPKLNRWPFGVHCQGGCPCYCNHHNCSCQEKK